LNKLLQAKWWQPSFVSSLTSKYVRTEICAPVTPRPTYPYLSVINACL
jgi:hypothetical protein